jgi:hypothetical protein
MALTGAFVLGAILLCAPLAELLATRIGSFPVPEDQGPVTYPDIELQEEETATWPR